MTTVHISARVDLSDFLAEVDHGDILEEMEPSDVAAWVVSNGHLEGVLNEAAASDVADWLAENDPDAARAALKSAGEDVAGVFSEEDWRTIQDELRNMQKIRAALSGFRSACLDDVLVKVDGVIGGK
jgi:hypothetical protein